MDASSADQQRHDSDPERPPQLPAADAVPPDEAEPEASADGTDAGVDGASAGHSHGRLAGYEPL